MASLHSRTREGLSLHLQISLQYRLIREQVGKLYTEFNMAYQDTFIDTILPTGTDGARRRAS